MSAHHELMKIMNRLKVNQRELADLLMVTKGCVCRYLKENRRPQPHICRRIVALAHAHNIPIKFDSLFSNAEFID